MPMDPHALLMDEMVKRAVAQQIQQEDAQPKPLTAPPEKQSGGSHAGLMALLAGGAADIGSTIYGLKTGRMKENNPVIRGMDPKIGIPVGAAIETGGYLLARKLLGKKHPKILNALSGAVGATHGALAMRNLLQTREAQQDAAGGQGGHGTPPSPNLVWNPDGYWWDPSAFQ